MIISDLSYLDTKPQANHIKGGNFTFNFSFSGKGQNGFVNRRSDSKAMVLPYGGSVSVGYSYYSGIAYSAPSLPSFGLQKFML